MTLFNPTALAKVFGGCHAVEDCTCALCGGPVARGEPVVPIDANDCAHRACAFMNPRDVFAFRCRRAKPKVDPVVNPDQLDLFGSKR